jgi:hypothetical protein
LQSDKPYISIQLTLTAMVLAICVLDLRAQSAPSSDTPATTQPSRAIKAQWTGTVAAFANALVDSTDRQALHELIDDDVIVRQFNRAGRQGLLHLREHVDGMSLIMSRSYMTTPSSMATDMANAIKDVSLPDEIKRRLTPGDEAAHKRANAIASKWIGASLFTNGNEPIAVIVLWSNDRVATTQPSDANTKDDTTKRPQIAMPVFILLKGDIVGERVQISQICFGDPLPFDANIADEGSAASRD